MHTLIYISSNVVTCPLKKRQLSPELSIYCQINNAAHSINSHVENMNMWVSHTLWSNMI